MAINSSQVQTQTQQQVQTLSPQQILAVKLLELPTVELEERIHAELLDNPALEEGKETSGDDLHGEEGEDYATDQDGEPNTDYGEDLSLGDYRTEDDIPDYKLQENNRSKDDKPEDIPFSDSVSFYETLKEQLDMQELTPEEKQLGEYLIGSLDDDGLLRKIPTPSSTSLPSIKASTLRRNKWSMYFPSFKTSTRRASAHEAFRSASSCKSNARKILP